MVFTCALPGEYMNSHDRVGVNIRRERGERGLRRARTELSGHMDVHIRAHMLPSDLGGEGGVHAEGESYLDHEIPGKMSHVWLRGQCTPSNRNAMRDRKYNTACVSSYCQTGAPAAKRPAPAWSVEAHMGEAR